MLVSRDLLLSLLAGASTASAQYGYGGYGSGGYGYGGGYGGYGNNKPVAVSPGTFGKIVRYHQFAAAAYSEPEDCLKPPFKSKILKFINATTTDTQVYLFKPTDKDELVVSFRGSSSPPDLDTDFDFTLVPTNLTGIKCPSCMVHNGFQQAYLSVATKLVAAIKSAGRSPRLVVTGHSLGGGTAALAATSLATLFPGVVVYSYGEPRNGNPAWAQYVDRRIPNYLRITHSNDGVPQIPPPELGYEHHSTEYWISKQSGNSAKTTFKCPGIESTLCNAKEDFGDSPINGAHITYHGLTASMLFNQACGYSGVGLPKP